MSDDGADAPNDTMRGRVTGSRLRVWLLMDADRHVVTATLLGVLFAAFVLLGVLDPVGLRSAMGTGDPVDTAFQGFITAIITGVTIVVTINQLVLSQELGAAGDQRERMAGALEFRRDVEDLLNAPVAPAEPSAFLAALVTTTKRRAETLESVARDVLTADDRERIQDYVDSLRGNADTVADRLDGAQFGTFDVILAALDFNYSWKIYEARRLRDDLEGSGDVDEVIEAVDGVIEALELFGPAREHFKTLYFQWELIDLSRAVLYAAVPAIVVATGMILFVDLGSIRGVTLGVDDMIWVVSAAVTVALIPFVLLLAYILRIATVTKRTLAIGPFVLRETDRTGMDDEE